MHLNTLGNPESRAAYRQALIDYLTPLKETLSKDSQRRLEENPLRVLDSKEKEDKEAVENAPSILDFLDEESQAHFDAVRQMLENLGVDYIIDTNMVRGLDYYNHTIFEFITEIEGNDLTVCAGGRYDGLVAYFGGPETAGFGFGLGVERLLLILEKQGVTLPIENALDVYIAVLGEGANIKALELVQALRQQGFKAERDYLNRKLKAQFKSADVFATKTLITLGESEVESGQVTVKNNQTREEVQVSLETISQNFSEIFEKLGFYTQ
ncbi:histidyl-tRNA synthetase [Streptococcus pneumoniae]|nr:histidyl-tRNA synthetase [Streptococcus pneumoniae]